MTLQHVLPPSDLHPIAHAEEQFVLNNMMHYVKEMDALLDRHGLWTWLADYLRASRFAGFPDVELLAIGINGLACHYPGWSQGHFADRSLLKLLIYSKVGAILRSLAGKAALVKGEFYGNIYDDTLINSAAEREFCALMHFRPRAKLAMGKDIELTKDTLILASDLTRPFWQEMFKRNIANCGLHRLFWWFLSPPKSMQYATELVTSPQLEVKHWHIAPNAESLWRICAAIQRVTLDTQHPFHFLAHDLANVFCLEKTDEGFAMPSIYCVSQKIGTFVPHKQWPAVAPFTKQESGQIKDHTKAFQCKEFDPNKTTWHPMRHKGANEYRKRYQAVLQEGTAPHA